MGAADRKKIGKITVKVVNAKNLKNQELLSKSDPYCKVILSLTTSIIYYHTTTYYIQILLLDYCWSVLANGAHC